MAKAKSTSNASYNKTLIEIQKLANNSAVAIQRMVNESNKSQMDFNSAESAKSRDWQEMMSKQAHQMEVADLKKAGLNPVLSANTGAQSYTTSSASTQNDSGASASAAILSDQIGAMSNLESARLQTQAQLQASKQQAEATKYAALQSAQAQKYAADRSAYAQIYGADTAYQTGEENRKNERWKTKNQTANTFAGMIDKALRNFGIYKGLNSFQKRTYKVAFSDKTKAYIHKNRQNFFSNGKVTNAGYDYARQALQDLGISVTKNSVKLYYDAAYNRNANSFKKLVKNYSYDYQYRKNGTVNPFKVSPGYR